MLLATTAGALPSARQVAGTPNAPGGTFGELLVSELNPVYYSLLKAGKVFTVGGTGLNPTAFTGAAAGTPLVGLYNPSNSGVDLVLLQSRTSIRYTGSAAAAGFGLNFFAVNQGGVAVTGTQTLCRQMYSQATTGSAAYAMVNTANTAALASSLIAPSVSLGNVPAAASLTAGLLDVSLIWAELPS